MSTKFYAYEIPKEQWWQFHSSVRNYYKENWSSWVRTDPDKIEENYNISNLNTVAELENMKERMSKLWKMPIENKQQFEKENYIDIQLFDHGDTFIFRFIEWPRGWSDRVIDYIMNETLYDVKNVSYWNNTDPPWVWDEDTPITEEDWERNEELADWADEKITNEEYFVCPIFGWNQWTHRLWDFHHEFAKKLSERKKELEGVEV